MEPKWNLCDTPGTDNGGKVNSVGAFLAGTDPVLVCTHATFRFALDKFGVEAFDGRLIAVDEFHHVSVDDDSGKRNAPVAAHRGRQSRHRGREFFSSSMGARCTLRSLVSR